MRNNVFNAFKSVTFRRDIGSVSRRIDSNGTQVKQRQKLILENMIFF